MIEIIKALTESVEKLGPFAFALLAMLVIGGVVVFAMWKMGNYVVEWNSKLVEQVLSAQRVTQELATKIQQLSSDTISRNTVSQNVATESNLKVSAAVEKLTDALSTNTAKTDELTRYMKLFGSDPFKLCGWRDLVSRAATEGINETDLIRVLKLQGRLPPPEEREP